MLVRNLTEHAVVASMARPLSGVSCNGFGSEQLAALLNLLAEGGSER